MEKTILVVDDETSLRQALHDKLESKGYIVIEAENGEEGLKSAINNKPDLILLDILMPKLNGFEMTDKLRQYEQSKDILIENQIPIIFLTNLGEEQGLGQGQKYGIYDYLVKSNWNLDGIVKKIKDRIGN